jgi:hypothetical protein
MLSIRIFDKERDYNDAAGWWAHHKWKPLPADALPQFGMIIEDGSLKIASGWLYFTIDKVAWLEWVVTNPEAPLRLRHQAIQLLLKRLVREAEELGTHAIFASIKSKGLIRLYQKCGFSVGDTGMTNVVLDVSRKSECQPQPDLSSADSLAAPAR